MTPEERALRDAWLAELWPVCHEVDHEWRRRAREASALLSEQAEQRPPSRRRKAS